MRLIKYISSFLLLLTSIVSIFNYNTTVFAIYKNLPVSFEWVQIALVIFTTLFSFQAVYSLITSLKFSKVIPVLIVLLAAGTTLLLLKKTPSEPLCLVLFILSFIAFLASLLTGIKKRTSSKKWPFAIAIVASLAACTYLSIVKTPDAVYRLAYNGYLTSKLKHNIVSDSQQTNAYSQIFSETPNNNTIYLFLSSNCGFCEAANKKVYEIAKKTNSLEHIKIKFMGHQEQIEEFLLITSGNEIAYQKISMQLFMEATGGTIPSIIIYKNKNYYQLPTYHFNEGLIEDFLSE